LAEERRAIFDDNKRGDDRTHRMTVEVRKGNTAVRKEENTGKNGERSALMI